MKENRNYGFKLRLYFGIILLIAAAIVGYTNFKQPDAQALYNEGNVYQRTSDLDNKTVALKVTQIGDQPAIPSKNGKTLSISYSLNIQNQLQTRNTGILVWN